MRRWHSLLEIIQFPLKMLFVAIILTGLGTLITNQSLSVFWSVNDRNILLLADLFKRTGSFIIVNFPFFVMIKFLATKSNSSGSDHDRNHRLCAGAGHHDAVSAGGPADVGLLGDSGIKLFFIPV